VSKRSKATFVLVDSQDVLESIGEPGFLIDRFRPMGDTDVAIDVTHIAASRCDIIARRLQGGQGHDATVPTSLDAWYKDMTDPVEIPDTTSVFVVSLADTVNAEVYRNTGSGVLVQPPSGYRDTWSDDAMAWLGEHFEPDPPTVENTTDSLRSIAKELERVGADLVVFNTSTFVPNEKVYWFRSGAPETTSVRAARMNLVVDSLVKELDIALVDVDRITAEIGAGDAVIGPATYTRETMESLGQETVAMILDLEGINTMFAPDAMQLSVPRYDRRTATATLTRWHVGPDAEVAKGDVLFDLRFGNIRSQLGDTARTTDRAINMSVVAGRAGFVDSILAPQGSELTVGERVGVITAHRGATWDDLDNVALFPVGVKVLGNDDR
jgi:hypothetical protein